MTTVRRIVGCQGPIQLATVMALLRHLDAGVKRARAEDHLVVYDLHIPDPAQATALFARFAEMARMCHPWHQVVHVTGEMQRQWRESLEHGGARALASRIHEDIGSSEADEVFLSRDYQLCNAALVDAYGTARRICYGDSIGLYFSERQGYFWGGEAPATAARRLWGALRHAVHEIRDALSGEWSKRRLLDGRRLPGRRFHRGYFMLPRALGEAPPMPVAVTDPSHLKQIFRELANFVDEQAVTRLVRDASGRDLVFLLTSNFSEARRMRLDDEIEAYAAYLDERALLQNRFLVIKPHPRDSDEKVDRLHARLAPHCSGTIVLRDQGDALAPFELFLVRLSDGSAHALERAQIVSFSTAALSLALLFGMNTHIGFGDDLVSRYFDPRFVRGRVRHEKDLADAQRRIADARAGSTGQPEMRRETRGAWR